MFFTSWSNATGIQKLVWWVCWLLGAIVFFVLRFVYRKAWEALVTKNTDGEPSWLKRTYRFLMGLGFISLFMLIFLFIAHWIMS